MVEFQWWLLPVVVTLVFFTLAYFLARPYWLSENRERMFAASVFYGWAIVVSLAAWLTYVYWVHW